MQPIRFWPLHSSCSSLLNIYFVFTLWWDNSEIHLRTLMPLVYVTSKYYLSYWFSYLINTSYVKFNLMSNRIITFLFSAHHWYVLHLLDYTWLKISWCSCQKLIIWFHCVFHGWYFHSGTDIQGQSLKRLFCCYHHMHLIWPRSFGSA